MRSALIGGIVWGVVAPCPDADVFAALADGEINRARLSELEEHLVSCHPCAELAAELARAGSDGDETGVPWIEPGVHIDRYIVTRWLGSGGMGQVYLADDPQLDRQVALKLVRDGCSDADQERLLREARAMAQLNHANVVAVHDAGVADGRAFIAMEWVAGVSLAELGPRGTDEIIEVMTQAGRGLAAAHDAGILHRDFKPANVLLRDDGRVMVTDFGLARLGDREPADGGSPGAGQTGLVGTLGYMAPEHAAGAAIDARSDQFSYCTTFWSLLFSSRPFAGVTADELAAEARAGNLRPVDASHPAARLRDVLARGLAGDATHRFASMTDLLAAIEAAERRRQPRSRGAVFAAGALALGAIATVAWFSTRTSAPDLVALCGDAEAELQRVWGPGQRSAVRAAFVRQDQRHGTATWERVSAALDDYGATYVNAHRDACRATHVQKRQSPEVLELRLQCLDSRRDQLAALVSEYGAKHELFLATAVRAVYRLLPIADCNEIAVLGRAVAPPKPELATAVARARGELEKAVTLIALGRLDEAHEINKRVVADSLAIGYRPLEAEAYLSLTGVEQARFDHAGSKKSASAALAAAQASGFTEVSAGAAVNLAYGEMYTSNQADEVERWLALARALIEKLGDDNQLAHQLAYAEATHASQQGDHRAALEAYRRATRISQTIYPANGPLVAEDLAYQASSLALLGETARAVEILVSSHERMNEALGPNHPDVMRVLGNLGIAYGRDGQPARSADVLRQQLGARERVYGKDSIIVAKTLANLSVSLIAANDADEAARMLRRAEAIYLKESGADTPAVAVVRLNLAAIDVAAGRFAEALERVEPAVATLVAKLGAGHPVTADAMVMQGEALGGLDRWREAARVLEGARDVQRDKLGADNPHLVRTLRLLGGARLEEGNRRAGLAALERASTLATKSPDPVMAAMAKRDLATAIARTEPSRAREIARSGRDQLGSTDDQDELRRELDALIASKGQR